MLGQLYISVLSSERRLDHQDQAYCSLGRSACSYDSYYSDWLQEVFVFNQASEEQAYPHLRCHKGNLSLLEATSLLQGS